MLTLYSVGRGVHNAIFPDRVKTEGAECQGGDTSSSHINLSSIIIDNITPCSMYVLCSAVSRNILIHAMLNKILECQQQMSTR